MPILERPQLAQVFIIPARNVEFMTTPGRRVKLLGGTARIADPFDMPPLLGRDDMTIEITPYGMSWIEDWLNATPQVKARVILPDGMKLEHKGSDDWKIVQTQPEWNGKNRPRPHT